MRNGTLARVRRNLLSVVGVVATSLLVVRHVIDGGDPLLWLIVPGCIGVGWFTVVCLVNETRASLRLLTSAPVPDPPAATIPAAASHAPPRRVVTRPRLRRAS